MWSRSIAPVILKLTTVYEWFVLEPVALRVGKKGRYRLMVGWILETFQTFRRKYKLLGVAGILTPNSQAGSSATCKLSRIQ
jgi:hypothetical protein